MVNEHERVVLTETIPGSGLEAGDVGTVVHVYKDGEAYEVEFLTLDGHTAAVLTLEATQVRPVNRRDITHTRTAISLNITQARRMLESALEVERR